MQCFFLALRAAPALFLLSLPVQAGDILLTKEDIVQIVPQVWAAAGLELPEPDADVPLVGPQNTATGVRYLRILSGKGDLNGFAGIVYDNRDRGHSALKPEMYPRLAQLKYSAGLAKEGFDFGLGGRVLLPAVVLGNSSTAMTGGVAPRSLPRLAMTNEFWRAITASLYINNHIYVYPEHRDYDDADLYPVNWPYTIISQGSSGSDQVFLNAVALTLASFPKDTFEVLKETRLVAPTIQMILRRNLSTVSDREAYLSGQAHPVVFDGRHVRADRMMAHAAGLAPEDIPPLVRLRVIEEEFSDGAGLAGLTERLIDKPAAIGRLWRDFGWEREMVVSAEDTEALTDAPLTFEWRLLRGDPDRVSIEPIGDDGKMARIRVAWHDSWIDVGAGGQGNSQRRYSRVDIGVFANNGAQDSAPAFISVDFPEHQIRQYAAGTDGQTRLMSVNYDAEGREAYFDPLLYWSAGWTDRARYDESGVLLGWDRRAAGAEAAEFVPLEQGSATGVYQMDVSDQRVPVLRYLTQ